MTRQREFKQRLIDNIPVIGVVLYVGLYIFSSTLYPGGSQANLNSVGFDWVNNYWCNLMNKKGMNGQPNPSRPISILAMIILSFSLMVFFIQFAQTYSKSQLWKRIIKVSGIISMGFATLIFTQYHDFMTTLASIFGLLVVVGVIREVFISELITYKIVGLICMVLLGLNNYIYYSHNLIEALPLLQKITFAIVLIWVIGLNQQMIKKKKELTAPMAQKQNS